MTLIIGPQFYQVLRVDKALKDLTHWSLEDAVIILN